MSTTETAVAEERVFTFEELKELNKKDNLHMLIHGRGTSVRSQPRSRPVYAISKFLDEVRSCGDRRALTLAAPRRRRGHVQRGRP